MSQLTYCQNFLGNLFYNKVPSDWDEAIADSKKLLQNFEQLWNFKGHEYNENGVDRRIKVAVIDNGTDRIKGGFKTQIATGISYVTATSESKDRILPWWTVADSHGTQMASYISQVNQYCRLYIARVGKGRRDILPGNAVKVRYMASLLSFGAFASFGSNKMESDKSILHYCSPDVSV